MDEALKGDIVPPCDTVGKHCNNNDLITEPDATGKQIPIGINADSLIPDDDGLSVGWLQCFDGDLEFQINKVISCIKTQRTPKKSHRLALFNVGQILKCGQLQGLDLAVIHDPYDNYECHSLITGYDSTKTTLMGLIALEVMSLNVMLA